MGANRTNIDPEKIPWDAIRTLVGQSIFGGKIDNSFDNKILLSLIDQFFRPESFNMEFPLYNLDSGEEVLKIPDIKGYSAFFNWIKKLPDVESPAWSGLPLNVEKLVKERKTL